jgi:hypothetical protein
MRHAWEKSKKAMKPASRALTKQDVKEQFAGKSAIQTVPFVAKPVETLRLPLSTEL